MPRVTPLRCAQNDKGGANLVIMRAMSKAVLLINLGTPARPTAAGLRAFYRHFFADRFVFDVNPVGLWLLRNLVILPLRAPRTARDYAGIWMEEGSPLAVYSERVRQGVQQRFDAAEADVAVRCGMAYSEPSIEQTMAELEREGCDEILVLPLYPQYARATTGSAVHSVQTAARQWGRAPEIRFVDDFFDEPAFVRAWADVIGASLAGAETDHVVFSYHGLPEAQLRKADTNGCCEFGACCNQLGKDNRNCYRAQCMATSRAIAGALGWGAERWSSAFQSRFGPAQWIKPYLDQHLLELLGEGRKRVAVITPSFVTDCLETLHEIGVEYRQQFIEAGGEELVLVPNLNDSAVWIDAVYEIASAGLAPGSARAATQTR